MEEFDPEKPTQVSAKVEYWFWLAVFYFQAFFAVLFLLLKLELSLVLSWTGAIICGFFVAGIFYLTTETKRKAIGIFKQNGIIDRNKLK